MLNMAAPEASDSQKLFLQQYRVDNKRRVCRVCIRLSRQSVAIDDRTAMTSRDHLRAPAASRTDDFNLKLICSRRKSREGNPQR
jgi:hypothetical protein